MAKTLFLFLFSPQVDSYINAIAYSYDEMKIEAVKLVYVKGTKTELTDLQASTLSNQIWNRIENLNNKAKIYAQINERLLDRNISITPGKQKNAENLPWLENQDGGVLFSSVRTSPMLVLEFE